MVRILIEKPTIPSVQNACPIRANPPYVDIYILLSNKSKSLINGLSSLRRLKDQWASEKKQAKICS